jgi:hypothetical protein
MSETINETFIFQPENLDQLYDWIGEIIRPALFGRILETETGIGTFSAKLTEAESVIELNASSENDRTYLREKFRDDPRIRAVHLINFRTRPEIEQRYQKAKDKFSTVIAIGDLANYGYYDPIYVHKAKQFLSPEGNMIITGRCKIDVYPGSEPDLSLIETSTLPYIRSLLTNCDLLIRQYFNWNGLSFLAVGRKRASETE